MFKFGVGEEKEKAYKIPGEKTPEFIRGDELP
ncbi:hypothetical protein ES707_10396 [subsurface metagenome]